MLLACCLSPHRTTPCADALLFVRTTVNSVSWNPDGTKIASGSRDKTVRVIDASTAEQLVMFTGHRDDGKLFVAAMMTTMVMMLYCGELAQCT